MGNSGSVNHKKPPRRIVRKRILLVTAGAVLVSGATGVAAYAKQGSSGKAAGSRPCTLLPNPNTPVESEERTCFSVAASVDRTPVVGETATVRFTVTSQYAAKGVRIEADLPAGLTWAAPPAGLASRTQDDAVPVNGGRINRADASGSFKKGEAKTYEGKVTASAPGPAEIRIRALKDEEHGVSAAEDAVFLTVGSGGSPSVLGIVPPAEGEAVDAPAPVEPQPVTPFRQPEAVPEEAAPAPSSDDAQPRTGSAGPEGGAPSAAAATTAAAAAPQACVTGKWVYVDNKGKTRPVVNASVQAWDSDESNAHDLLGSGVTSSTGTYKVCFANTDGTSAGQDVYVKMFTTNSRWKVQKTGTTSSYVFKTKTLVNVKSGTTANLGTTKPTDASLMRALQAFDVANDVWLWVPGSTCWDVLDTTCRQLVLNWAPGSQDGNYYGGAAGQVFLKGTAPDSRMTVAHEITHALMADVYEDKLPPIPNCNPHGVSAKSSTGCAWVEGFAEWLPASVYNDPYYRWPSGASMNLETPNKSTAGWDDGDAVEGRVAGALIDIADSTNEGNDIYGEGDPGNIWQTFIKHRANTFREFWEHRKADGYNTAWTGALKSVYQNTIDYR